MVALLHLSLLRTKTFPNKRRRTQSALLFLRILLFSMALSFRNMKTSICNPIVCNHLPRHTTLISRHTRDNYVICAPLFSSMLWCKVVQSSDTKNKIQSDTFNNQNYYTKKQYEKICRSMNTYKSGIKFYSCEPKVRWSGKLQISSCKLHRNPIRHFRYKACWHVDNACGYLRRNRRLSSSLWAIWIQGTK